MLRRKLSECRALQSSNDRGRCFEDFVKEFLKKFFSVNVVAEHAPIFKEVDIVVKVDEKSYLVELLGKEYVVVECKLHRDSVKADEISDFLLALERMKNIGFISGTLMFIIPRLAENAWDRLCSRHVAKELKIVVFEEEDILSFLEEIPEPERIKQLLEKTVMKNMSKCGQ